MFNAQSSQLVPIILINKHIVPTSILLKSPDQHMQTSHTAPVQRSGFASPCLVLRVQALSRGCVCHRSPLPASGCPSLQGARRPPYKAMSPVLIPASWVQGWGLLPRASAASG